MIIAAYIVIAAALMGYVFRPLFADQGEVGREPKREGRKRGLFEERERVYDAIRELDFDYRMGKVEEDDYRETRARFEAQGVAVLKAIDKSEGRSGDVASQVEQEVASIRQSRKGKPAAAPTASCPSCNTSAPADAKFCPQCGAALTSR